MTIGDGNRVWLTLTFSKLHAYLFYTNRFQTIFTEYIRYAIFIFAYVGFNLIFLNFFLTSPHQVLLIAYEKKKQKNYCAFQLLTLSEFTIIQTHFKHKMNTKIKHVTAHLIQETIDLLSLRSIFFFSSSIESFDRFG